MTSIKCKYRRWRCGNSGCMDPIICEHHDAWGTGYEYDECCSVGLNEPYEKDGNIVVPIQCRYVYPETVMFEKNVKTFSFDDDELIIGRLCIETQFIEKLTIDGEVLIDADEEE